MKKKRISGGCIMTYLSKALALLLLTYSVGAAVTDASQNPLNG
jgi:hypothetical protein